MLKTMLPGISHALLVAAMLSSCKATHDVPSLRGRSLTTTTGEIHYNFTGNVTEMDIEKEVTLYCEIGSTGNCEAQGFCCGPLGFCVDCPEDTTTTSTNP
eukprot:984517_1